VAYKREGREILLAEISILFSRLITGISRAPTF